MKKRFLAISLLALVSSSYASNDVTFEKTLESLQRKSNQLHRDISLLKEKVNDKQYTARHQNDAHKERKGNKNVHDSIITAHSFYDHPESMGFYPTALVADDHVITYIAGTPVVSSPYLGDRPAFDGSDYLVNVSSINRDLRLMQQRYSLYKAYEAVGYPAPQVPIIAISGKVEPFGFITWPYSGSSTSDVSLGASELDIAAIVNENVEAFMSIAYDDSPQQFDGPRVRNSRFFLNMGFINIGNLAKTPFYFTAGQMFLPFGKYSSAMVTSPLTMRLGRTKTRPVILGYKPQHGLGMYAAVFGYKSEVMLGRSGSGGVNLGYAFGRNKLSGDVGVSYSSSLTDSDGLQFTGGQPRATFGGFSSRRNGSELVKKIPGVDVHANLSFDHFNFAAEWVGATQTFRAQDLSYDGRGAKPQAGQLELGTTFMLMEKPASVGVGYQWSEEALAIRLPEQSYVGVFNISIWKDTVESLEYRHDRDYAAKHVANGAAPVGAVNASILGTGRSSDTVTFNIGVYF